MADRYWVGGTGTWTQTTHWSTSSGGASGASYPTATDNAFFDGNSGSGTASLASGSCLNLVATGYIGALDGTINVKGDCVIGSGGFYLLMVLKLNGSGAQSLTSNGESISGLYVEGDASSERTVAFEDAATSTSGNLYLNNNGGAAVTLRLKDGVTHAFSRLVIPSGGPSSGVNALQSTTPGAQATLNDASGGNNNLYYVYVSDIAATGGTFTGVTNAYDAGNNSGFTSLASAGGGGLFFGEVA